MSDPWALATLRSVPPARRVLRVAVLGFDLACGAAGRFVAACLVALGASPVGVGLFASTAALAGALFPALAGSLPEDANARVALAVLGVLSPFGLVVWVVAPYVAPPTPAWLVLAVGAVVLHAWKLRGVGARFAASARRPPVEPVATGYAAGRLRWALLALAAPALVALFASAPLIPAFHVLLGVGAALGLAATVAQLVLAGGDGDATAIATDAAPFPTLPEIRRHLRALDRSRWRLLVGDTFAHASVAGVYVLLVVYVAQTRALDARLLGGTLPPAALFALCIGAEAFGAVASRIPGEELGREFGPRTTMLAGAVVAALVPPTLALARGPWAVVFVFLAYGFRHVADPARHALLASWESDRTRVYRAARALGVVPAAAAGGFVYAASPALALWTAGLAGLVAVLAFRGWDSLPRDALLAEGTA